MEEKDKTKIQLLAELEKLRQQVAELKTVESEHRRTQEAVQTAKEYAENLIDSSLDMIISVDMNRRIVEFNCAAERTFGYSRAEVLGKPVGLLYADPSQSSRVHSTTSQDGQFTGEVMNKRKSGELFCSYLSASVMRNANGEKLGFMGISRDITDRKLLERQRAEFLSLLTHDIKKPLATILACAEMVLEEVNQRRLAEEVDLLEKLRGNVLTIDTLVTNYLYFSKIEVGQLTLAHLPVDIQQVLRRVEQRYEAEAQRKHILLAIHCERGFPCLAGDPFALERAFANLVENALKFTSEHGRVTVQATHRDSAITVSVADTGPGIPRETLPIVLDKSRRAHPSGSLAGTGLGLFVAKTLVEAHGGQVEVESAPDCGSCVVVSLPLVSATKAESRIL